MSCHTRTPHDQKNNTPFPPPDLPKKREGGRSPLIGDSTLTASLTAPCKPDLGGEKGNPQKRGGKKRSGTTTPKKKGNEKGPETQPKVRDGQHAASGSPGTPSELAHPRSPLGGKYFFAEKREKKGVADLSLSHAPNHTAPRARTHTHTEIL
jgi:hypothetical protein